jgi:hypothetical protein
MANSIVPSGSSWFTDNVWSKAPSYNVYYDNNGHNGNPAWRLNLGEGAPGSSVNPNSQGIMSVDFWNAPLKPGDHIVFSAWLKTSAATNPVDINSAWSGAFIGMDMWGPGGDICAINPVYVKFGTSSWTQVTLDFIVLPTYTVGSLQATASTYHAGDQVAPTYAIPYFGVWGNGYFNEQGTGWFSDPVFDVITSG